MLSPDLYLHFHLPVACRTRLTHLTLACIWIVCAALRSTSPSFLLFCISFDGDKACCFFVAVNH